MLFSVSQELWSKQNGICGAALDLQEVKKREQEAKWVSEKQNTVIEYSKDLWHKIILIFNLNFFPRWNLAVTLNEVLVWLCDFPWAARLWIEIRKGP